MLVVKYFSYNYDKRILTGKASLSMMVRKSVVTIAKKRPSMGGRERAERLTTSVPDWTLSAV